MTQEEKELLLVDLSARLPYGVKVDTGGVGKTVDSITIKPDYIEIELKGTYAYSHFIHKDTGEWDKYNDLSRCRPYLRSLSSMTEEEKEELYQKTGFKIDDYILGISAIDWLNAHHFDYRGLIEKGLAIAVTKESNPYERK